MSTPSRHRRSSAPLALLLAALVGGFGAFAVISAANARTADVERIVTIRGHPHTVIEAIVRQLDHYGYHIGQIVQLARHFAGDDWTVLTVPRGPGATAQYNRRIWKRK